MSPVLLLLACTNGPKPEDSPSTTTPTDSADADTDTDTDADTDTDTDTDTGPPVDDLDHDYDGDGYTENEGDCNDAASGAHPGARENCKGGDLNCDGDPSDHCVRMEKSQWRRWTFGPSGATASTAGLLWRGLDGTEYCRLTRELQVAESRYPCPDCEYAWEQFPDVRWLEGPGCGTEELGQTGVITEDTSTNDINSFYWYESAWTGSWRGYDVAKVFAFLAYDPYSPSLGWVPTFVGGLPYWDVYRYTEGDYQIVGYTWPIGRYEDTGFYYVDPTYP